MKLALPFDIPKVSPSIELPVTIFQSEKTKIILSEFAISDRELFFGLQGLQVDDTGVRAQHPATLAGSRVFNDYSEYLQAKYQFSIEMDTQSPAELQRLQYNLDFACRVAVGRGCRIAKFIEGAPPMMAGATFYVYKDIISRRRIDQLDEEKLTRLRQVYAMALKQEESGRVKLFKAFLSTAMAQVPNTGISGALYVSILESLFVPEKDAEIGYRFSLRLTKKRGKDSEYRNKVKELYGKRSGIFHGGEDRFTIDDLKFVEEEACWAIEEYLTHPESFLQENLDLMLLGRP